MRDFGGIFSASPTSFRYYRELNFLPAETLHDVIVDHPYCLHEGIANGCPGKGETSTLQLLAHRVRFPGLCGNVLQALPGVLTRLSIDKLPEKRIETARVGLDREKRACILNGRLDLQPVSHDLRI